VTIVATVGDETTDQNLVFLSAATGRVMRSMHVDSGDGPLGDPVVSYDRKTAYFTVPRTSCTVQIDEVPTAGGPEAAVALGYDPAISPDGHWLAFTAHKEECSNEEVLVVKNLDTDAERRWSLRGGGEEQIVDVAWAPDSRHLAVLREFPRPPGEVKPASGSAGYVHRDLWVLDTRAPGTTVDSGHHVPGIKGLYARVTYRGPEGTLLILGVPSNLDYPSVLYDVDSETRRTTGGMRFPHTVYKNDFDATAQPLIYVWNDVLYRWVDGVAEKIADGITGADW